MQRYFIKSDQLVDDQAIIVGNDAHHIRDVMRASVGDRIIVCTCDKKSYLAEITHLHRREIKVKIVESRVENAELAVFVSISQGIVKGDKFDMVVQKGTECGATGFIPVSMKRSVAKIDPNKARKKMERWQKIALEAARQSHRQVVPYVNRPVDITSLVVMASEYDMCLFAYEECGINSQSALADAISELEPEMRVLVLFGPEGGIAQSEVCLLIEAGFRAVGLGPRILRAETASIYVMSAISYALEIEGR